MNEINQPLNDDWEYELPARVVSLSLAGSVFVRLFLDKDINIDSDISYDKPKNVFLKGAKNQSFEVGNYILVKAKGWIVNQYVLKGKISENTKEDRSVVFIKELEEDYQDYLDKNDAIISFDKLKDLRDEKFKLSKKIEELQEELSKKLDDIKDRSNRIKILQEISDLEQANESLKQEKDELLSFKKENQWLEKVKPYVDNVQKNIDIHHSDAITRTQSKPLFNKITKLLKDRFNLSDDFIHCYLLSLLTSLIQGRFLLLTGHIGTGKSSIIKETGKLIGGQTNMVAVRPAWLDASDLLGYFDPINNRYHSTDFVKFLRQENNNHINMILLDELNIARIENYGADILACLAEIGERNQEQNKIRLFNQDLQELIHTYQVFEELTDDKKQKYQHILDRIKQSSSITIPDNVLICGTLNIDGSTENLSPKMIDRSFMLKFPDFDGKFENTKEIKEQIPLFISQIINSLKERNKIPVEQWNYFYKTYIEKIKDSLIPISNRVAKDYLVFCQFAEFFGIDDNNKVDALFFYARILPRLRIEKLDKNARENIVSILNLFSNTELFVLFTKEINDSKNNGGFIDYQHICG